MSFYTALSGLKAAQTDMASISHNIANVATNGFKKSRTDFADVISSSVALDPTQMVGSGVVVKSNRQQFGQGNIVQSSSSLDIAISGDGFFAVKPDPNASAVNYTRNGAFLVDKNNNVTDANGNFLQVYPVDGSGNVIDTTTAAMTNLVLPATSGTPKATGVVTEAVNLNSKTQVPTTTPFSRTDATSYNQATTSTIYDAQGNPQTLTNYYVRNTAPATDPTDLSGSWTVYSFVGDHQLTSGNGANTSTAVTFDSSGALTAPAAAVSFDAFQPSSGAAQQSFSLNLAGSTEMTTPFKVASQSQDGVAVGQLQGVTVGSDGIVKASFSNGDVKALGQITLVNFANPSGLRQLGDSTWASTGVSGSPVAGAAGEKGLGNLMSGAIERSNVDITEELVNLIAAQRNFQANSKSLDTDNQMTQAIFNIRS